MAGFPRRVVPLDHNRSAAVAVVLTVVDGVTGFWLTRRPARMREHPGQFALPGGRVEPGEDLVTAALRETREELGLTVDADGVLGMLDDYPTRSGYRISPVVCWTADDSVPMTNPAEVARLYFVPLADLARVTPRFISIPESDRPVIQMPLVGELVHAPTGAVIYQFAELALHDRHTRIDGLEQPVFAWR
nr:CoA pyrophosphatase [Williamsia sterculiae]